MQFIIIILFVLAIINIVNLFLLTSLDTDLLRLLMNTTLLMLLTRNFIRLMLNRLDPNLTTLVDFDSKWKDIVEEETPIPTPDTDEFKDKVGAFEGGGYMEKGIYRPMHDCSMKSITVDNFCPVCKRAIQQMIDFYSE
ncbi:MAG: M64 family metallopeptidase [Ignavibacteriales bacterium]|nr:M64 family metallopeptidase [Ignavibacteriales bacterium]